MSWNEQLYPEQMAWIEQQLLTQKLTLVEIVQLFYLKFPQNQVSFSTDDLRAYAKEKLSGWQEKTTPGFEEVVKEAVEKEDYTGAFLTEEDKEKINTIKKHRRILKELWENYQNCKADRRAESSKVRYLEQMSRQLIIISDLESVEKSLMSQLAEVRKAQEEETAEQTLDYICGWALCRLVEKAQEPKNAQFLLEVLGKHVEGLSRILDGVEGVEEGVRVYLNQLYGSKEETPDTPPPFVKEES